MNNLIAMANSQTMTSIELTEVINTIRKEEGNTVVLQHSHLMTRIKGFASILPAASIREADYTDKQGQFGVDYVTKPFREAVINFLLEKTFS